MARLNTRASTVDTFYRDRTPTGTATPSRSDASPSPPTASFSSDKENRSSSRTTSGSKRTFGETSNTMAGGGKRRRLQEQGAPSRRRQKTTEAEAREQEDDDKKYYDPNQDPEERRGVRMAMRSNARELHGEFCILFGNLSMRLIISRTWRRASERRWQRTGWSHQPPELAHGQGQANSRRDDGFALPP